MAYRDDLEAAHARTAALEAELARVSADRARLRAANASPMDDGATRIAELAAELARAAAECDRLRAAATGISAAELERLLAGLAAGVEREASSMRVSAVASLAFCAGCLITVIAIWNRAGAAVTGIGLLLASIMLIVGGVSLRSAARIADPASWRPVIDAVRDTPDRIVSIREVRMGASVFDTGGRFVACTATSCLCCYHRSSSTLMALLIRRCPRAVTPPPR